MKKSFVLFFLFFSTCMHIHADGLSVLKMGDPILEKRAEYIQNPRDEKVMRLAQILLNEIVENENYLGLAAPQIGESIRMIAYKVPKEMADDSIENGILPTIMINPSYVPIKEEKIELWEGCISIPNLLGKVPRYKAIRVTFQDVEGAVCQIDAYEKHAQILQHEIDHLDGIFYISRMRSFDYQHFGFRDEIRKYIFESSN